jgi:hypothetical protein
MADAAAPSHEAEKKENTFFSEKQECLDLIAVIAKPGAENGDQAYERLCKIYEKYQEQPHLLDPHLEAMIEPVMVRVKQIIHQREAELQKAAEDGQAFPFQTYRNPQLHQLFQIIYQLSKTRGYKTIVKFLPHEVCDLEPTLRLLKCQDRTDHSTWETRYALFLWLSMLSLIPFDLKTVDSSLGGDGSGGSEQTLIESIIFLGKSYLSDPGATREMAALCLSRLLTRPDMDTDHLTMFTRWVKVALQENNAAAEASGKADNFVVIGVLLALAQIFKQGHREKLLCVTPMVFEAVLERCSTASSNTLQRKLAVKLMQRLGMTFMPPKVVSWRYNRGQRSLLQNLDVAQGEEKITTGGDAGEGEEDEEEEPPEEMDEVVNQLLCGLRDKDTVVRWSAAKGIGRITGRLPAEFGDDVVAAVLDLFVESEGDGAWHGGCLALAELARRGLLLPSRLPEAAPVVVRALDYDVRRGQHSVGSHVRDAACYVCWAFARAYEPQLMAPHVQELARAMLKTAVFDREVNCRRAASAAFQENVGRQGHENFPDGIAILTAADYFSLGSRPNAYLRIAPFVAQFVQYRYTLIEYLVTTKLQHWDIDIRRLSAQAIGRALTPLDPRYMAKRVLPRLLKMSLDPDLLVRHGATMAAAEVVRALGRERPPAGEMEKGMHDASLVDGIDEDTLKDLRNAVPRIEKARLYRGRGGEAMRGACCELIEAMAYAAHPCSHRLLLRLLDSIDDGLKHPNAAIQGAALGAFRVMMQQWGSQASEKELLVLQTRVVDKYVGFLRDDPNPAVRRGFALALGALPTNILAAGKGADSSKLVEVLDALVEAMQIEEDEELRDAEARRNATLGLAELCMSTPLLLPVAPATTTVAGTGLGLSNDMLGKVFDAFMMGTEDYSRDNRGDVGSWVRIAAMRCLHALCVRVLRHEAGVHPITPAPTSTTIGLAGASAKAARQAQAVDEAVDEEEEEEEEVKNGEGGSGATAAGSYRRWLLLRAGCAVSTPYGEGTVLSTQAAGFVLRVKFEKPSLGAFMFPYGDRSVLLRRSLLQPVVDAADTANSAPPPPPTSSFFSGVSAGSAGAESDGKDGVEGGSMNGEGGVRSARLLQALMKQLSEKLDTVRSAAGTVLESLLRGEGAGGGDGFGNALRLPSVPEQDTLERVYVPGSADGKVNWSTPGHSFPLVVQMLPLEPYRLATLQGLLISVGGLTESVVKCSAHSLLKWGELMRYVRSVEWMHV